MTQSAHQNRLLRHTIRATRRAVSETGSYAAVMARATQAQELSDELLAAHGQLAFTSLDQTGTNLFTVEHLVNVL